MNTNTSATASTGKTRKRDELIDTATRLFSRHGYHATGIDIILAVSGVAKRTLYNHFRSKEELIVAVLQTHADNFFQSLVEQTEALGEHPIKRLLGIYTVAGRWFKHDDFYGCLFINAAGEYGDTEGPIRDTCQAYKQRIRNYMFELCHQAGYSDPDSLADTLALLLEGAIVTAQVNHSPTAAHTAHQAAQTLIAAAPRNE